MERGSKIERKTKETAVLVNMVVDGKGSTDISTGIGFFDHMLNLFAMHSQMNVGVKAEGDIFVDSHHTIEDVGIVLGLAFAKALQDKKAIKRYGHSYVPMDEALALVCIDISGRAFLVFDAEFSSEKVGELQTQMVEEFFRAFANNAGINIHIKLEYGENDHHKIEAIFKAFGRAIREAVSIDPSVEGVLSTKGTL